jgi:hypothetical protein
MVAAVFEAQGPHRGLDFTIQTALRLLHEEQRVGMVDLPFGSSRW